jgi:inosine-uridine nucleoside N-ribohydrolase
VIPLLVDCDPGQDDAIALLLALASPEVDVLGVTTVGGNQTVEKTTTNALKVLELAGRTDIPVAVGAARPLVGELVVAADAHGDSGLDGPSLPEPRGTPVTEDAADFLARRLLVAHAPVTLVALGPLTNVALLLALRPEAAEHIERLVLMGGAIGPGNMTPAAEFNIWTDPEAAERVFTSGLDLTMVGLDVTNRSVLTRDDATELRTTGAVGAAVADMLDFYLDFYLGFYEHGGAPIHDAVAVAEIVQPGVVTTLPRRVEIERNGLARGRTLVDMRRRVELPPPNAHVAVDVDADAFRELLLGRLANFPPRAASEPVETR